VFDACITRSNNATGFRATEIIFLALQIAGLFIPKKQIQLKTFGSRNYI
jgi:hypothetical protein